jgi:hypothetical protein
MKDGGMGSLTQTLPIIFHPLPKVLVAAISFLWFRIYTINPGHGLVALPGFEG